MKIKNILGAIALIAFASVAHAQPAGAPEANLVMYQNDLDSTSETFCALEQTVKRGTVAVSASNSTTLTGTNAFTNVAVGDYMFIGGLYNAAVIARASASSITLSGSAITVTDVGFTFRTIHCSTTLASDVGSFPVARGSKVLASFNIAQQVATGGIDVRLVCKANPLSAWIQVWPVQTDTTAAAAYINYTTGTIAQKAISISDPYTFCKFGFKIGSGDDGDDATTNAESISAFVTIRN